ncbi:MAG: hypothetical protein HY606_00465 [Planctomycetes bacterium]|nr:hypothetical protein [Planctomycetota bacterium]
MGYVGNPKTTYNRIPFEKSVYMQNGRMGVKNIKPASLFGGIYQHNNAGSLDDWERIDPNEPAANAMITMMIGGKYDYEIWGGSMDDWISGFLGGGGSSNNSCVDQVDSPTTAGASYKDGIKHHAVDLEVFCNTGTLNHNLHPHGLGSASKPKTSAIIPRKNYLEAHRWSHVVWQWYIKFNRKPITVLPGAQLVGQNMGSKGYQETPIYTAEHEMKIYINGMEVEETKKVPYEPNINTKIDQRLWMKGGRRPVFSLNSWQDAGAVIEGENNYGNQYLVANVLRIGESMFSGFTFNKNGYIKGNIDKSLWPRNYSGDYTVDELYVHGSNVKDDGLRKSQVDQISGSVKDVYKRGRYYVPKGEECRFESTFINFDQIENKRKMADEGRVKVDESRRKKEQEETKRVKLMGVQWTWYGEDWDRDTGEEVMYDYRDYSVQEQHNGKIKGGTVLKQGIESTEGAAVRVDLIVVGESGGDKEVFAGKDSAYTEVESKGAKHYELKEKEKIKYRVVFRVKGANTGSVLLATPVFDDVSIFFSEGVKIISYSSSEF